MSWYGSRAVGCPIGREITARTMFSSWKRFKRRNTPRFRRFFLEKRPWKRFSTNVLIRGKWIHSTANWWEQSCTGIMLLQKNLSRKISPEKSLDFWSQKSVLRPALLDDSKSSKNYCPRKLFSGSNSYCPRKLFSGSNSSPEKSLQKNCSIFCLETGVIFRLLCLLK